MKHLHKILLIPVLIFYSWGSFGQAFNSLTYSPVKETIDVSGDNCGLQLFVSPKGNDNWSGMKPSNINNDGPFATVEHARNVVRKLISNKRIPSTGVAINFLEGVYTLNHSIELTESDGGKENAPVVYRAWKDATVEFLGGKKLSAGDFAPVTDASILSRVDSGARGSIVQLDTKKLGLNHTKMFPDVFNDGGGIFELFVHNKRMPLSRWPDEGNSTMKEVVAVGDKNIPGSFIYRDDRPERWRLNKNIWLKGFWRVGWEEPAIKVESIDRSNKQINFKVGIPAGIGSKYNRPKGSGKEEWYAINLLEEITKPGEWCIDFETGILYWWMPEEARGGDIIISQLSEPIISGKGVSNVVFEGITFEGSLGDGLVFSKSSRNLVAGCTIKNLGGSGIVLDGEKSGIQSCDMFGLGKGCIVISGGDREKLTESGNYVVNNHLHDYGVLKSQYSAAVDLYSENKGVPAVGMLIAHNLVHHAPRDGFLFAGNKIVFEFNELHRCAYATADVGAFYSWMDWTIRGIVIRYNYIHNTVGGVNPDDGASGTFVYGNIFAGNRTGVWIASGPDHVVENNVFIKNEGPVFGMDERGLGRKYATNKNLLNKVNSIHPNMPPWSTIFPEMPSLLESHPELPLRTKFNRNVVWVKKGEAVAIKLSKEHAKDTNLIQIENNFVTEVDPGFKDAANGNWMLKNNSPVFEKIPHFPKIPFDKMGLYIDKYRKKLPTPAEAGRLPEQNPFKKGDTDMNFGT